MCSGIRNRQLVDLVSVLVDDDNEPTTPVPARHDRAMFEVACQCHRVFASGGIAGQVNAFVITQNLFAVGEMKIERGMAEARVLCGYNSIIGAKYL